MKLWWLTNFARLGSEKAAVEALAADEAWFSLTAWTIHEYRFAAVGVITAHGFDYPIRLVFPDQFPLVPPWVEPQDPDVKWSSHQYGKGGTLCLQLRPDNWTPHATGADMLRSAFSLLETENPLGDGGHARVPSAHRTTAIQEYTWGKYPVLIGEGCLKRLKDGETEEIGALRWNADDDTFPILVFDKIDRSRPQHPPSFDLGTWRFELPVWVARMELSTPLPSDKIALAHAVGIELESENIDRAVVVLVVGQDDVTPLHVMSAEPDSVIPRKLVVLPDQLGMRSGRKASAETKKVAIIGLGSVGSKIAESMLRSGVYHFALIDGDVMFPANLERHTLDWRDVGFRKARAIERRLHHIVPGATVEVITANLSWQRSAKTHGSQIGEIADCSLIIDATGDTPTSLLLGAIAAENRIPFVSVEVFEGGLGCALTRFIPGRDPVFADARAAYSAYCDEQVVATPPGGKRPYEALDEDANPIVADDAAVSIAAAHAARIALDILDDSVHEDENALKLIGFKKGWLFSSHGHVISLKLGIPIPPIEQSDLSEVREFAIAISKEALDAAKASK